MMIIGVAVKKVETTYFMMLDNMICCRERKVNLLVRLYLCPHMSLLAMKYRPVCLFFFFLHVWKVKNK